MWHHCRQVSSSCSASQSRPLPFFSPRCDSCCSFYVVQLRIVVFFQKRMILIFLCLDILPTCHLLLKSCLLGLTLRFRSCLSLPPGYLDTREAGTCAGSRACFSFSFSSIFLLLLIFAMSFRQPSRDVSSCVVEKWMPWIYVKLSLGSPTFQVPTPYSTTYYFSKTVSLCNVCLRTKAFLPSAICTC